MPPVLIDTNVLVYLYDQREPHMQDQAAIILRHLEETKQGRLSAQNLAEFYVVSTRRLNPVISPADGARIVDLLGNTFPVYPVTQMVVNEAVRGARDHGLAYYDSQLWALARLNQIPLIFSEDFQDGQFLEGIRFVNPFVPNFDLDAWV